MRDLLALEAIVESVAIRRDQAYRRLGEMHRQDQRVGAGDGGKKLSPRHRRLFRIPVRLRRPFDLAALDHVVHEISRDYRALAFRKDVDAAMARRMTGR